MLNFSRKMVGKLQIHDRYLSLKNQNLFFGIYMMELAVGTFSIEIQK